MIKKYKTTDLVNAANNGATPPNCDLTLQITPTFAKDGIAKGIWNADEKFINGHGIIMGGYIASAADTIMAYAISSILKENQTFASINLHTTFHRPVKIGTVEIEARVERLGKNIAYMSADIVQKEKIVGNAVSSIMIIEANI